MQPQNKNLKLQALQELTQLYASMKNDIIRQLNLFRKVGKTGSDFDLFVELVYCLFTPQTKAHAGWTAVQNLLQKNLLLNGSEEQISAELNIVRFRYNKAKYLVAARRLFMPDNAISIRPYLDANPNVIATREWLVQNVKGLGYKEASHYLRNIGLGENLAILDRHILRNLLRLGAIRKIPDTISPRKYLHVEEQMREFARQIQIPLAQLDLLLWYKETGEIFK